MRALILSTAILWSGVAHAEPGALEQALGKTGLADAQIKRAEGHVSVTCKYAADTLDEARLRNTLAGAMVAIREAEKETKRATLNITLADAHVIQVAGDPGGFRPEMDEVQFIRAARVRFLTRGPALTPGPCLTAKKMSCKTSPQRCPCEPGSLCEPGDTTADAAGCLSVRAAKNTETSGPRAVCKPDHTWDMEGNDCVPIPDCGGSTLHHGEQCVCLPGIERNKAGGCGPMPEAKPDAGPDAGPPGDGGATAAKPGEPGPDAAASTGSFARWVWQAMAVGVGLSVPIALFLIGSIISGLRSKRSRIGLKKFCIRCGRKLAMDETACGKCKTPQP